MENNIYAAPEAEVVQTENEPKEHIASRRIRFAAAFIDGILAGLCQLPLTYFLLGEEKTFDQTMLSTSETLIIGLFGIVIYMILHGYLLVKYGQSLGKRFLSIKIVTVNGDPVKVVPQLSLRYGFIWGIGLIPIVGPFIYLVTLFSIFTKSKRCGHDYVAGTKVVYC